MKKLIYLVAFSYFTLANIAFGQEISLNTISEIKNEKSNIRNHFYKKGMDYYGNNNFEVALEYFERNIVENKIHLPSYFQKAIMLKKMRRFEESYEAFNQIITLDGTFYFVYLHTAEIMIEFNDYNKAMKYINLFLSQNAHSHEGFYIKAKILYKQNNFKEALYQLNKALLISNKVSDYHLLAGQIRIQLKSNSAACISFKTAADLNEKLALDFINQNCIKR